MLPSRPGEKAGQFPGQCLELGREGWFEVLAVSGFVDPVKSVLDAQGLRKAAPQLVALDAKNVPDRPASRMRGSVRIHRQAGNNPGEPDVVATDRKEHRVRRPDAPVLAGRVSFTHLLFARGGRVFSLLGA